MDTEHINTLLNELSDSEKSAFEEILLELKEVKGDLSQLSAEHQSMLATLAATHLPTVEDDSVESPNKEESAESAIAMTANENESIETSPSRISELDDTSPTDTLFGQYVVDQVKTLCEGGSSLADAIRYAFHNKYLPPALREEAVCKDLLQRYQADILTLADSFKSLESAHVADAKLLVGFAWFAVIYDCYQHIETFGDLS